MERWIEHVKNGNEHVGNGRRFCPKTFNALGTFTQLRRVHLLIDSVAFAQRLCHICSTPRPQTPIATKKEDPARRTLSGDGLKGTKKELRNTNNNLN